MSHLNSSAKPYFVVFALLLALLLATSLLARHDFGAWNFPLSMLIASAKALLIAWYFMELRVSVPLIRLVAGAGLLWLLILFALTLADYLSRGESLPLGG